MSRSFRCLIVERASRQAMASTIAFSVGWGTEALMFGRVRASGTFWSRR
jgi:hypothetical protein